MAYNDGIQTQKPEKSDPEALHAYYIEQLGDWQESDLDQREQARECDRFVLEKDGQWEDSIRRELDSQKRPRYTFDKVTPIIESVMADIEDMEFSANVKPADGAATKETALTLEGMIRSIQNMSKTEDMFRKACRRIIRRGFDAWIIKAKFKDEFSFDQDLFVEAIPNAINRVWCSNTCTKEDSSDSKASYVLSSYSPEDYKEKWPDGKGVSVEDSDIGEYYDEYRPEVVTVAERYYMKENTIEIAEMSNGDIVEMDEDFEKTKDEREAQGITVRRTKKAKNHKWYHCVFDGHEILEKERVTAFISNPVITVYGNHELLGQNSKITYYGLTLKEMDPQRVHNYAKSRDVEEGALSPRAKWWMTKKQAVGHENQIGRMNVSADPVQFFNPDTEYPGAPQRSGGPLPNQHLSLLAAEMANDMKEQAGVFDPMMGKFAGRQSEDSVRMQINRGTATNRKWVNALINGIVQTCKVLLETMPVVYDTKRVFDITGVDGTESSVTLNEEIYDQQSREMVNTNILNLGKYKVTASFGEAFSNRMEAGLDALLKYAELDPSVIAEGGDIMLKAIDAPLVDKVAERKRDRMLRQGMIPPSQMTDDEKEIALQIAQQPPKPDPMMVAAQAEMKKADADVMEQQNKRTELQLNVAKWGEKTRTDGRKDTVNEAKAVSDIRNTDADTAKTLAEIEEMSKESFERLVNAVDQIVISRSGSAQ
ncbi:MAG: portal protein [Nitrosomonadaceae bacterium]